MLSDKKVIFLDIDGVIMPWCCDVKFYSLAVSNLNSILEKTSCEIVVTSDWRISRTVKELGDIFSENGIIKKPIAKTRLSNSNYHHMYSRPHEIIEFLDMHDIRKFAVIDDMNLTWQKSDNESLYKKIFNTDDMATFFNKNFFRVLDDEYGLSEKDAEKIISHLNLDL